MEGLCRHWIPPWAFHCLDFSQNRVEESAVKLLKTQNIKTAMGALEIYVVPLNIIEFQVIRLIYS